MLKGDEMFNMVETSSPTSILSRIYHEKTWLRADMSKEKQILNGPRCILPLKSKILGLLRSDLYLVLERNQANLLFTSASLLQEYVSKVWVLGKGVLEFNRIFYYSLRHEENEQRIGSMLTRHIENGLMKKLDECKANAGMDSTRKHGISVFESLEEFIEDSSGFSNLGMPNFRYIFLFYFLICSLIFVAFCVHHLANFIKKRAIFLPLPLRRCFTRLAPDRRTRRRRRLAPSY